MSDDVAKITELEIRLRSVERKIDDIESRVENLERNNVRHSIEIEELPEIRSKIDELLRAIGEHNAQIAEIKSMIDNLAESSKFRRNVFWQFVIILVASLLSAIFVKSL